MKSEKTNAVKVENYGIGLSDITRNNPHSKPNPEQLRQSKKLTEVLLRHINVKNDNQLKAEVLKKLDQYDIKDPKTPQEYKTACAVYVAKETALIGILLNRLIDDCIFECNSPDMKKRCEGVIRYLVSCGLSDRSRQFQRDYEAVQSNPIREMVESFFETVKCTHSDVMIQILKDQSNSVIPPGSDWKELNSSQKQVIIDSVIEEEQKTDSRLKACKNVAAQFELINQSKAADAIRKKCERK